MKRYFIAYFTGLSMMYLINKAPGDFLLIFSGSLLIAWLEVRAEEKRKKAIK